MTRRKMGNPLEEFLWPSHQSKRCGAHARSTGLPCTRWAAIGSQRCRLHGGARGSGHPPTHGRYTAQATRERRFIRLVRYLLRIQDAASR